MNCAVLCVKDDWKRQFWGLRYCLQNCAVYSVFPSGMTSHSEIAQLNWEWTGRFTRTFLLPRLSDECDVHQFESTTACSVYQAHYDQVLKETLL